MTISNTQQKAKSAFQRELANFGDQIKRLANCLLNKIFDLTMKGSQRRQWILIFLFFTLGALFILGHHPLAEWSTQIGNLFSYLLSPEYARENLNTPGIFYLFLREAFKPEVFRYLPIFILPFLLALQFAAMYLTDIFELKDVSIAREFIRQVALTGSQKSIRIGNGEIAEKDRTSPIYLIGGPGQVVVELDSVALFEKPDGSPHVIGSTVNGKVTLEGFERFRQVIDLRDQYTDPQSPVDVKSRSLDGIPVGTKDVRFVYSIWRNDKPRTPEFPHPFGSDKTVEDLVYRQSSTVVDAIPPSIPPEAGSLFDATIGVIRRELGGFMSKHRLAEYLASISMPEVEQARKLENEIVDAGKKVVPESDPLHPREVPPPPDFKPRSTVSDLFNRFTEGFTNSASVPGIQLQWIGVGTWKMPSKITDEIITGKHLEAWRLSRENVGRGGEKAINSLRQEAGLQQTLRLIQKIPLARYKDVSSGSHRDTVNSLLLGYREQLIEIKELLAKSHRPAPPSLGKAIRHIEDVLGIKHWAGVTGASSKSGTGASSSGPSPTASDPETPTGVPSAASVPPDEQALYEYLLQITGHDTDRVERLIEHERNMAPNADRVELIQRAIERRWRDNR